MDGVANDIDVHQRAVDIYQRKTQMNNDARKHTTSKPVIIGDDTGTTNI